eukprot:1189832-Prorocentrum_minimum.AAC.3
MPDVGANHRGEESIFSYVAKVRVSAAAPSGPPLDPLWTPSGPPLDPLWTPSGPPLDPLWTPSEPPLAPSEPPLGVSDASTFWRQGGVPIKGSIPLKGGG